MEQSNLGTTHSENKRNSTYSQKKIADNLFGNVIDFDYPLDEIQRNMKKKKSLLMTVMIQPMSCENYYQHASRRGN